MAGEPIEQDVSIQEGQPMTLTRVVARLERQQREVNDALNSPHRSRAERGELLCMMMDLFGAVTVCKLLNAR